MTHRMKSLALAATVVAVPALVPSGAFAASCKLTADEEYHRSGKSLPTYTRSLRVSGGASCGTGHKLLKAYYRCRVAAPSPGKKGRCTSKVLGYSCSERRFNSIKTQFDAKVSCRKGRARINHDYTQFT
ncbi:MAG TPA: hypothetical protein VD931_16090 [Baekduia sp.]|nr:hypothetical protein [Baekduia sp.]